MKRLLIILCGCTLIACNEQTPAPQFIGTWQNEKLVDQTIIIEKNNDQYTVVRSVHHQGMTAKQQAEIAGLSEKAFQDEPAYNETVDNYVATQDGDNLIIDRNIDKIILSVKDGNLIAPLIGHCSQQNCEIWKKQQ